MLIKMKETKKIAQSSPVQSSSVLHNTAQYIIIYYCAVQYVTVHSSALSYGIEQQSIIRYIEVQCNTV